MIKIDRSRLLVVAVMLVSGYVSFSQTTIRLSDTGYQPARGQMHHLRDESNSMTFDHVLQEPFSSMEDVSKPPSFGFDRDAHWFRMEVTNDSPDESWILEIPYAPLDEINFYIQADSGWLHKVSGDIFPISERELAHRHPVFTFEIKQGQTKLIFLRIKTISSVQAPITFWATKTFHAANSNLQLINGLFYGAMFIMILYQLFLFFSTRDRITAYYVVSLISMANVVAFFQGYTFLYIYPSRPELNDSFAALTGPVFIVATSLLTRSFLSIKQFSKPLNYLMVTNAVVSVLVAILMVAFNRQISYKYHHFFVIIHCMIVLASAGFCLYKRYRPALYYLLAWASPLLAAVTFTMGNLGFVPGYLGTNYNGLIVGCVLQVLFIALAIGEKWNNLVKENEKAKELELKRGLEENERLEREVKLRTLEIQLQNEKLSELNRIKDKLFSVVSHDIKAPLTSLKLSLALAKIDKLNPEEFAAISTEIENHLDQTTNFIQNLLQWAKFQLQGETVKPTQLDLQNLIQETLDLLETEFRQKVITVHKEIHHSVYAYADPTMTRSVIRNLLTNAIKFTPAGGNITIAGKAENDEVIISVKDTGAGIPPAHQKSMFTLESLTTPGTQQETGTGLGLVLCKEFVEKNNGRIWFITEEGAGTTFYISLPEFKEEFKYV